MLTSEPTGSAPRNYRDLPEWSGSTYADNTAHHRHFDDRFVAPLRLRGDERILDIGCGVGDLTARVAAMVPGGLVLGVDPSASMLDIAESVAGANQSFAQLSAQDVATLAGEQPFDVVLSRAALHWVPAADHPDVLSAIAAVVAPGGTVRLEFGGSGSIAAARELLNSVSATVGGPTDPWCFPDAGWYLDALVSAGFDVADNDVLTVAQRRRFDRDGALSWYESQVEMAYTNAIAPARVEEFRSEVRRRFDELQRADGSFDQVYVRLEVLATLPAS